MTYNRYHLTLDVYCADPLCVATSSRSWYIDPDGGYELPRDMADICKDCMEIYLTRERILEQWES